MPTLKVVILTTGGTIAMRYDLGRKGVIPAVTGVQLVEAVLPLAGVCPVEVVEFSNIPSPHMTPRRMLELAFQVERLLQQDDVQGVVITHGTDTLEETAYLLDLVLAPKKPVCLTAAMRSASSISPDGPMNILCAVQTAASPEAWGKGVLVVMNEEIHAAREVTKTHSANVKAFSSPFWGPLGYVDEGRVIFCRAPLGREQITPAHLIEDVYLVKLVAGSDDYLIRCLVDRKVSGIVLEGLGRGNVPPAAVPGIKSALEKNIPVITTRVSGGRVLDIYDYEGSVKPLREAGVVLAGEVSGPKARLKLMLLLGLTRNIQEIACYFDRF